MKKDTDIELSEKQKEVIKEMRKGYQFNIGGCNGIVISWEKQKQLRDVGLIKNINPFVYELTESGKKIQL